MIVGIIEGPVLGGAAVLESRSGHVVPVRQRSVDIAVLDVGSYGWGVKVEINLI